LKAFSYSRPDSVRDAVAGVAADREAKFLAGGTNLVDLMRLGVERPDTLIDVRHLLGHDIEPTADGGLLVGSGVANSDLAVDPRVRQAYPVLSQALLSGASGQLRNAATVGGNLLQRTRCVYFQDVTKPCNKRQPGSGCPAREGSHRDLGILGTSEACIATHPSDMAVALAAVDATVHLTGPGGERTVRLEQLYRLPGDDPSRDTTLEHAELITAVQLPPPSALYRSSRYRKVRDRASFAFAVGSIAAAMVIDDGLVREVRIAFGAVAPRPWRAHTAEDALRGQPADAADFAAAIAAELELAEPLRDNAFKVDLTRRMGAAVLTELAEAQQQGSGR